MYCYYKRDRPYLVYAPIKVCVFKRTHQLKPGYTCGDAIISLRLLLHLGAILLLTETFKKTIIAMEVYPCTERSRFCFPEIATVPPMRIQLYADYNLIAHCDNVKIMGQNHVVTQSQLQPVYPRPDINGTSWSGSDSNCVAKKLSIVYTSWQDTGTNHSFMNSRNQGDHFVN